MPALPRTPFPGEPTAIERPLDRGETDRDANLTQLLVDDLGTAATLQAPGHNLLDHRLRQRARVGVRPAASRGNHQPTVTRRPAAPADDRAVVDADVAGRSPDRPAAADEQDGAHPDLRHVGVGGVWHTRGIVPLGGAKLLNYYDGVYEPAVLW